MKDLHQESHEKSKGNLAWQSSKGKGQTDETLRQTQLIAQGNVAIKAVEGLKIDIKHIDQQSVSQAIAYGMRMSGLLLEYSASQSNDEAITAIQQELIRLKYGDRTAFALQVLQMAAAGNLAKMLK